MPPERSDERRFAAPFWRWLTVSRHVVIALMLSIALISHATSAEGAPLRVRVHGAARLTAHASRDQVQGFNELVLSGSLGDDAGQPLAVRTLTVRVTREADPHDAAVAQALRGARGCDRSAESTPTGVGARHGPTSWGVRVAGPTDAPEIIVVTDEAGRFCFRARLDPDRYRATLVYSPTTGQSLVDGLEREIAFDLSRRGLGLRFDPTPKIVQLDTPSVQIEAVAILDDDATPRVAPALLLVLANEREELVRAVTDGSGRARFVLPGSKLGPPGAGELRVSFAGDGETARANYAEEVERHVKVVLKVPSAERGELTAAVPEDGIPLVVEVGSGLGPVAEGSIEARVGDVVVGAAPVERGIARLTLTFAAQGTEALVHLRYVSVSPWYEPLSELSIRVPIRGPSLLSKAPILIAGLAVLAFFLVGRVSGQKSKPEPRSEPIEAIGEGKPRMEVVRSAESARAWVGKVVDAHDGTPIGGAIITIERGTFDGRVVLASTETGRDGRFELPGLEATNGDEELVAEGRLHARFVQPLPLYGALAISLAQRRRALLAKLVGWARRRGPPFDVRPEPTPGHVRRAATGEIDTARWAEATERAVFGPEDVDADAEQAIERLAPVDNVEASADRPPPDDVGRVPRARRVDR